MISSSFVNSVSSVMNVVLKGMTMDCKKERNAQNCTCTHTSCENRGACCACIQKHLANKQLPGCCFPPEAEKTYDRSFANFAKAWKL